MKAFNLAKGIGISAGLLLMGLAAACGGGSTAASDSYAHPTGAVIGNAVTLHYTVVGPASNLAKKGPDGKFHDSFFTTDSTTLKVGDTVTVIVSNYDDVPHGMVLDGGLAVSQMIPPAPSEGQASVTTFTFTASKAGTYRWYCPMPCDTDAAQWAMHAGITGMGKEGFMAGTITVA